MEVFALTSRFILQPDPAARFGYAYTGKLPFDDAVVDLVGNAPSPCFASNADFRGKDDVGDTDEDPNHTGRTSIFVSPGLRIGLPGGIAAYWAVQIPVYQRVNGIQLTARQNLLGGIQARF